MGYKGNGTLNVEAGGVVANTYGYIGHNASATGVAKVTGSGSQWNNSQDLSVGDDGTGTLNVEAGGVVSNTDGYLRDESGSTGTATISGVDSTWATSGDLHVGKSGSSSVNIADSGEVQVGGMTQVYANGTVNIDGGTMLVDETLELDVGSTFNLNSGTLSVRSFSGDGSLVWNGGTLEITTPTGLTVGSSDPFSGFWEIPIDGTLNVTNTTTIESEAKITALGDFSSDLLKIESGGPFDVPRVSPITMRSNCLVPMPGSRAVC